MGLETGEEQKCIQDVVAKCVFQKLSSALIDRTRQNSSKIIGEAGVGYGLRNPRILNPKIPRLTSAPFDWS